MKIAKSIKLAHFVLTLGFLLSASVQAAPKSNPFGYARCGTAHPSALKSEMIESSLKAFEAQHGVRIKEQISVCVYFHVIQDSNGDNDATSDQMLAQIDELNQDYSSAGVSFSMCGSDVTVNDDWFAGIEDGSDLEYEMKSQLRVGDSTSLNVYLGKPGAPDENLLGYATFPWDYQYDPSGDGIVILYSTLPGGDADHYNQGKTLTHEAGHWLGLYHTFQPPDSGRNLSSRNNGCKGRGDYIRDTPSEKVAHYTCRQTNSCPTRGKDPIHNFMDYTEDSCLTSFSAGQADRIQNMWSYYRAL